MTTPAAQPILTVRNLHVHFGTPRRTARAVDGVSFEIGAGETLGLVGESGCGKSVTSLALMGLISFPPGLMQDGTIDFAGQPIHRLAPAAMRRIRGADIAMIFQEPMTSLNPVFTIGNQLVEAITCHEPVSTGAAWQRSVAALNHVGIPKPDLTMTQYPHELSGGMKQRAMIAMGLLCRPRLLICDEPTTALDVTIQAQILDRLRSLQAEQKMSMLFITHDLGVVAEMAHRVCVMYAGLIVESATTPALFAEPLHPYTLGLFRSLPQISGDRTRLFTIPGSVPAADAFPAGCRFAPRCERATDLCRHAVPPLEKKRPGRLCACHHVPAEAT